MCVGETVRGRRREKETKQKIKLNSILPNEYISLKFELNIEKLI